MDQNKLLVKLENAGVYRSSKWLVRGISLEINQGQIVTLIGPNGSGKTTTAKMILNILNTDEGLVKGNANRWHTFLRKLILIGRCLSVLLIL